MLEEDEPPIYPIDGSLANDLNGLRQRGNKRVDPDAHPQPSADVIYSLSQPQRSSGHLRIQFYDQHHKTYHTRDEDTVVTAFFSAIEQGQDEIINSLISNNLVNVNTLDITGRTPLVAAVESAHVPIVQQLMDFGADINAWSFFDNDHNIHHMYRVRGQTQVPRVIRVDLSIRRTPLMVAARNGSITLVKLLKDVYHADDSLIAIDGQTALRLAAVNGHREVVDILPSIRGGGLRRWKYKNRRAFRRIKHHTLQIYHVFKCVFYYIPRFFVWSVPKHLIVLPARDCAKWLHKNRNTLVTKFVNFTKRWAKQAWEGLKKLPKTVRKIIRYSREFMVEFGKWLFKIVFVKLPRAMLEFGKWGINAFKDMAGVVSQFLKSIISALHSLVVRILNIVKTLTWADVGRGFLEVIRWIFIGLPQKSYRGTVHLIKALKKFLIKAFGDLGHIFYLVVRNLLCCMAYIPIKLWKILAQFGSVLTRAGHELRVYHNPKYV